MKNTTATMTKTLLILSLFLLGVGCESPGGSSLGTGLSGQSASASGSGVSIVLFDGALRFSDASYASSCFEYKNSDIYSDQGDGLYWVYPATATEAFKVLCDMETDSGGWTLVDNVGVVGEYFTTRDLGANTDLTTTRGGILPAFEWSDTPKLLCKSSHFTGTLDWLTFSIISEQAKDYPTSADVGLTGAAGHFATDNLNGNTDQGSSAWVYNTAGRIGTIWIGNGSQPTCACNYTATAHTGLGGRVSRAATCSTWVR